MEYIILVRFILWIIGWIIFCIFVSLNARKMGYSSFLWFLVSALYSPLVSLFLLAALPNRKLEEKRKEEMRLLQKQLARRQFVITKDSSIISHQTISDDKTIY